MKDRFDNSYFKIGLCIFASGAALILLYEAITNLGILTGALGTLLHILSPFIYGLVMAYLLCPIYNAVVRRMYGWTRNSMSNKKKAFRLSRVVATIASLLFLLGVVGGLFAMVLPETISSLVNIVQMVPERLNDFAQWAEDTIAANKHPQLAKFFDNAIDNTRKSIIDWSEKDFLPRIGEYMSSISQGVIVTVKTLFNILIGVIVCVYFLNSKETFKAQSRKTIIAVTSREKSREIFDFANFCNRTFGGFINGKIIDSFIIGIICFIGMTIIGLPYPMLISGIIGVTNIIPFFGPFIGAIPATIIICVISPVKALYFVIWVIVLQTFDGNILGPKILGGSTGLASFWVMFAIILCGGIFGFAGMILGVPVFAVMYYYLSRFIEKKLSRKNLPMDTVEYTEFNQYDINRKDLV